MFIIPVYKDLPDGQVSISCNYTSKVDCVYEPSAATICFGFTIGKLPD